MLRCDASDLRGGESAVSMPAVCHVIFYYDASSLTCECRVNTTCNQTIEIQAACLCYRLLCIRLYIFRISKYFF